VPGIVVHGAGHFYAGKKMTSALLFGAELGGVALVFYGVNLGIGEMDSERTATPNVVAAGGAALFLGSWIYDIIGAPLTIVKENEKILGKQSGKL
jgi:hypothetical protein